MHHTSPLQDLLRKKKKTKLEAAQIRGQAGFRNEFSCDDYLFVVTMLTEKFPSILFKAATEFTLKTSKAQNFWMHLQDSIV